MEYPASILVAVLDGEETSQSTIAVDRLRAYSSAAIEVVYGDPENFSRDADLVVALGVGASSKLSSVKEDSYLVETVSQSPLTVLATGTNERAMLYAVYRLADLLRAKADLTGLNQFYQPRIGLRYLSFGATTHGRRVYRPELYWRSLHEMPRFGYNGVIIYPGGGTPIGRHASPVVEAGDGSLSLEPGNTESWKEWLAKVESYGLDIMMTLPPIVPPGYSDTAIADYYAGGPEPPGYLRNLQSHFRRYLELLTEAYPESDLYMFNSTEGATFGHNARFFNHPDPDRFPMSVYLDNNEAIMRAYFDVLVDFFGDDIDRVCFWTHSFGITSEGIVRMREVLFTYPKITNIEDDFWNNNLWPQKLPAMAYLPEDLRAEVSERNPFALFQIGTDGEYHGGGSVPNAYVKPRIDTAHEALDRGARMLIQRFDLHDRSPYPYGTAFGSMEIVPLSASRQLWDPTPATDEIWQEWAVRRFGREAAPYVVSALQESDTVVVKGLTCNGMDLLAVGSAFIPRLWKRSENGLSRFHLFGKPGEPLLKKGPGDVILSPEYTVYQMDTHTIPIEEFRQDQDEALEAARRGLKKIEDARPYLDGVDYTMLQWVFSNGVNVLTAMRLLGETAYATNIILDNFDNVPDPEAQHQKAIAALEAFLAEDRLIPPMTRNVTEIVESYKEIAAE